MIIKDNFLEGMKFLDENKLEKAIEILKKNYEKFPRNIFINYILTKYFKIINNLKDRLFHLKQILIQGLSTEITKKKFLRNLILKAQKTVEKLTRENISSISQSSGILDSLMALDINNIERLEKIKNIDDHILGKKSRDKNLKVQFPSIISTKSKTEKESNRKKEINSSLKSSKYIQKNKEEETKIKNDSEEINKANTKQNKYNSVTVKNRTIGKLEDNLVKEIFKASQF